MNNDGVEVNCKPETSDPKSAKRRVQNARVISTTSPLEGYFR